MGRVFQARLKKKNANRNPVDRFSFSFFFESWRVPLLLSPFQHKSLPHDDDDDDINKTDLPRASSLFLLVFRLVYDDKTTPSRHVSPSKPPRGCHRGPDWLHFLYYFDNGYGASVARHRGTYGYEQGLFELAVIKKIKDAKPGEAEYDLVYDTPITCDVLGYLTVEKVNQALRQIRAL